MYIEPNKGYWTGRIDSELDSSTFRFHQEVQMKSIKELDDEVCKDKTFGLLGFECDEGVRRNKGKVGAAEAPIEIKKALAKLPWPFHHNEKVLDVGSVFCEGHKLEKAQQELGETVQQLIQKNIIPIIIGGGHETAYAHYLGVREAIGRDKSLGVINIDAHFDLRPYDEGPSSGTMFKQILDSDERSGYLCVGVQTHGNTKALFTTAHEYGCHYLMEEDLAFVKMDAAISKIDQFISQHDFIQKIYLSTLFILAFIMWSPIALKRNEFSYNKKRQYSKLSSLLIMPACLIFIVSALLQGMDNPFMSNLAAHLCLPSESLQILPPPFNTKYDQMISGVLMISIHQLGIVTTKKFNDRL